MSTDMSQVGVVLFPSFKNIFIILPFQVFFYINIVGFGKRSEEVFTTLVYMLLFPIITVRIVASDTESYSEHIDVIRTLTGCREVVMSASDCGLSDSISAAVGPNSTVHLVVKVSIRQPPKLIRGHVAWKSIEVQITQK